MIGVLASGTGTNLQALLDAGLPVVAVASNRAGAGALDRARTAGVDAGVFALDDFADREQRDLAIADFLAEHGVDLVVLAGYMHLLTPAFLDRFPGRILNVHPSLLPSFAGAHAVEDALAHGVKVTGVTVHLVDQGLDTGPILLQEAVRVEEGDTRDALHARLQAVEHRLLPRAVALLLGSVPR